MMTIDLAVRTHLVSCEGVELCHTEAQTAVSVHNPYLTVRTHELGAQGEPAAHTQRAERTGVKPAQWTSWPKDKKYVH